MATFPRLAGSGKAPAHVDPQLAVGRRRNPLRPAAPYLSNSMIRMRIRIWHERCFTGCRRRRPTCWRALVRLNPCKKSGV